MKFADSLGYEPFRMQVSGADIYGIHAYGSLFAMNVKKSESPYLPQARRVYAFKKFGRNTDVFVKLIETMKTASQADVVLAIPSSKADKVSILQGVFGIGLKRNVDSEQRKYNHGRSVDDAGKVDLLIGVTGKKVLLVDDVVTTGKSIVFYRQMLLKAGAASVIAVGVGISLTAAVYRPEHQVVDKVFDKIKGELGLVDDEMEGDGDQVEEDSLEAMLQRGSNNLRSELVGNHWIEVSGHIANKIRNVARQHKVSEAEVIRMAVDVFDEE